VYQLNLTLADTGWKGGGLVYQLNLTLADTGWELAVMDQSPFLCLLAAPLVCHVILLRLNLEICRLCLRRFAPLMANAIDTADPSVHHGQNNHEGQHSDRTQPNHTLSHNH
jgi:hypothetical protein